MMHFMSQTALFGPGRVDVVEGVVGDVETFALPLRPDGYVAWAADTFETDDEDRLHAALQRWFGAEN
jgi:hypothetical protein